MFHDIAGVPREADDATASRAKRPPPAAGAEGWVAQCLSAVIVVAVATMAAPARSRAVRAVVRQALSPGQRPVVGPDAVGRIVRLLGPLQVAADVLSLVIPVVLVADMLQQRACGMVCDAMARALLSGAGIPATPHSLGMIQPAVVGWAVPQVSVLTIPLLTIVALAAAATLTTVIIRSRSCIWPRLDA